MFSIQDLITKKLSEREDREIKSWHASKLGMCTTGVYLERLGVKPDTEFDSRTLRVFSAGKLFEDWIVGLIENETKIEKQVRIELPEYNLTGYADLVVNGIVYEIKSKHSKAFWYMDKKGEGASRHNQMQLWCYLKALNLEEGRLIYVSKDDLSLLEYQVRLDDEKLAEETIKELEILNEAWKTKIPPKPITDPKDWRAKYCRYHKQCLKVVGIDYKPKTVVI